MTRELRSLEPLDPEAVHEEYWERAREDERYRRMKEDHRERYE